MRLGSEYPWRGRADSQIRWPTRGKKTRSHVRIRDGLTVCCQEAKRKRPGGSLARIGGSKGRCFSVSGSQRPLPLLLAWDIECWRVGLRVGIACCNPLDPGLNWGIRTPAYHHPNVIHFFLPLRRSLLCALRIPHVATETVGELQLEPPHSLNLPSFSRVTPSHPPTSQCRTSFLACKYKHNSSIISWIGLVCAPSLVAIRGHT